MYANIPVKLLMPSPSSDELFNRLVALSQSHNNPNYKIINLEDLTKREIPNEPFVVRIGPPTNFAQAVDRVEQWLDEPNPAFDHDLPRRYLNGSSEQRAYFDSVIGAIENGEFS